MKDFAKWFYGSNEWKNCRDTYSRSVGRLCELCAKQGRITPAEIIHHKQPITPNNINDPSITLNPDNLLAVCREHHAELHRRGVRRFVIDECGRVVSLDETKRQYEKT